MAYAQNSKTVSLPRRECIISMWTEGESYKNIAKRLGISSRAVSKIVAKFIERGHVLALKPGGKERRIANHNVVENVEFQKICKPSTSARFSCKQVYLEIAFAQLKTYPLSLQ